MKQALALALGAAIAAFWSGWRASYRVEALGYRHVVTFRRDRTKHCRVCKNRSVRATQNADRLCVRCTEEPR